MNDLLYREIESLSDPLYDDWLDLYQRSFPVDEQMMVSWHNRAVRARAAGSHSDEILLAAAEPSGRLAAMARYDHERPAGVTALWYLAVSPQLRGLGIGTRVYQEILRRMEVEFPGARALVYEVADPEHEGDPEREEAVRRIAFYRRNGAAVLRGIRYVQDVEWQPPRPMLLMFHPRVRLSPDDCLSIAGSLFGDAVRRIDRPSLE